MVILKTAAYVQSEGNSVSLPADLKKLCIHDNVKGYNDVKGIKNANWW